MCLDKVKSLLIFKGELDFCGMSAEPSFSLVILTSRADVLHYLVFIKLLSAL